VARPGRAGWHDRATVHGQAVLPGTAVPGGDGASISCFTIFFDGAFFSSLQTLDLAFQFTLLDWQFMKI